MKPNQNRLDSVRSRLGGSSSSSTTARRKSRRDQEAHNQRMFRLGMIGVTALVVLILGIGVVYEYVIKPNQVLATVNGQEISREDYWQYQSLALYNQARQYETFATQVSGDQQQQFLQFAASFDAQRKDVWGSTDVSGVTLQQMVDDQLFLAGAESMGIALSDQDVEAYALNEFAPADAPLVTPIPSPTLIPERAAWATETAEALATQNSIAMGTPVATPVVDIGTPGASPSAATPIVESTPAATPIASTPEATPDPQAMQDSLQAANAEFELFEDEVFEDAHLDREQYMSIWARPRLARELVTAELTNGVSQTAEQVNAQHIMVATEDLANQLHSQATGGADFAALARSNSTDTATASTGGELGWFTRLEVSPAFADAAFSLDPGQISPPFKDGDAWHIVKINERDDDRPMTDTQYNEATTDAVDSWLKQQQEQADISSDDLPTPTPTTEAFVPPAGAPTPVPATPIPVTPTPTPPLIGPQPVVPGASPVATPQIPGGTPAASASPVDATPLAATPVTPEVNAASPAAEATP
ncbi:MAG TPA: peptidylprolyl isomerase [Thermomicrobiales bacterium]|nr:peptidylprolyl isomerase [Thermomicrobiales bacterium]